MHFLLGRRTYVTHAQAFEPMAPGDPFGDMMNPPKKFVVSRTLEKPIWRNTTIIRENVIESVRELKAPTGRHHFYGRKQPACARAAGTRSGGRVTPASVPTDVGER